MLYNLLKVPHQVNTGTRTGIQAGSSRFHVFNHHAMTLIQDGYEETIWWGAITEKFQ